MTQLMWTHRSIGHDTPARREVLALFKLSWPVCTCSLLTFSFQFINMLGAGRLGKDTLAAVALANSYFNIVSYFVIGAATSIDTLVSQAYGRSDIVECQQWLIRSLIVFSAASLPLCGLLASAGPIFRFCNFREDMVEPAVTYLMRLLPGTPFFIWFTCLQKYQQSMNLMAPALGTLIVCSVVNVGATAWAVSVGQLTGLAWILTMARILLFAVMVVAFFRSSPEWRRVDAESLKWKLWSRGPLSTFLKLSSSGAFMTGLEAMAFEITVLAAGALGTTAIDAHNILLQIIAFIYLSVPLGVSIAATIRIGNLLGRGDSATAKLSAQLCIGVGTTFMLISAFGLYGLRHSLGSIFSPNEEVIALVATVAPVAACFQLLDGFQGVSGGVLRAMGQQAFLAKSIFFAFWVVALPIGYWTCFSLGLGIFGLWVGLAVGLGGMALAFGCRVFLWTDWEMEASKASKRSDCMLEPLVSPLIEPTIR